MEPGAQWTLPAAGANRTRVLYAHSTGGLNVGGTDVAAPTGVQLQADAAVALQNGDSATELLLLEGQPIGEPVAQHGPFVMNTRGELQQAFADYQKTQFGGWPWPENDPVVDRNETRFARHADGRIERPDAD
jgi:hypothetical protein